MRVAGRTLLSRHFLKLRQRGQNPRISGLRRDSTRTTLGGVLPLSYMAGKSTNDPISALSVTGCSNRYERTSERSRSLVVEVPECNTVCHDPCAHFVRSGGPRP